jgi:hypothetical protein
MWKANGKTTTLQLFLDSLSPKNMLKLKIALFGELSLEEAMDLSRDKYLNLKGIRKRLSNPLRLSVRVKQLKNRSTDFHQI